MTEARTAQAPACGDAAAGRLRPALRNLGLLMAIAAVLTVFLALDSIRGPMDALRAFAFLFVITCGIGGTVGALYTWLDPGIRASTLPVRLGAHAAVILLGTAIGGEIALWVNRLLFGADPRNYRLDVLSVGLVVSVVVTALELTYSRLRQRARTVELREQEVRQHALRAELRALQASTNPHFLFNTLNTVAGLVEEDPPAAIRMLERLSSLFRYALEGSRRAFVRLEDELEAVRDYLEVEQIRFEDRLRFELDADRALERLPVPPFVLQPVVENAILHGVAPRREGGAVTVRARRAGRHLELTVEDDGPGPGASGHRGTGTALDDLRERLRLAYGDAAGLELRPREPRGTVVRVRLPITEDAP